ncbi:MAG: hypothetical protein M3R47_19625 [Chloroflexota bacterium]|nr:hypothetical protein [Chloroflexota bacterium]
MDYLYFAIGGFVICAGIFKRDLLTQKRSFRLILLVSVALFLVGAVLHFTEVGRNSISGALLCPLITLAQYRLSRKVFLKYVKREPKDTFFIYTGKDLGKDRLFSLLYFIPATWLLMLVPVVMEKLAKAGW